MKRLLYLPASCTILLLLISPAASAQFGPVQQEVLPDPPRFILQFGGNLSMPTGDLGTTDPMTGGFATQGIGYGLRGYYALTGKIAVFAGISRYRFGYDTTMLEEQLGLQIDEPKQGFLTQQAGMRFVISDASEAISYLHGSVGNYRFRSQATSDGDPLVGSVDPSPGYSFGVGIMNRHLGPGFDVTFAIHAADITFPNGYVMKARWISFTLMTGLAAGSVR